MADYNLVVVSGTATKDATLRRRHSTVAKAEFSIEVDRPFQRANGESVSDLFLVDVYGRLAEHCADVVTEGTRLIVLGTLNKESYVTRHGRKEHMILVKCKYFRVAESDEIDFRDLPLGKLRQDHWGGNIISSYLELLSEAMDTINRR